MSQLYTKGEAIGLPEAGKVAFGVDASGSAFLLLSDGSRVSVGGASGQGAASLAWLAPVAAFIVGKAPTLTNVIYRNAIEDWSVMEMGGVTGTTGRARLVAIPGSNNLKLRLSSGTGANSYQQVRAPKTRPVAGGASVIDNPIANCRTTPFAMAGRVIINAVHATAQNPCVNITDEATADASLGVLGATSLTNFVMKLGAAAAVDTGVPFGTLGVSEHDLIVISDGVNYNAYIDLVSGSVGTVAANNAANAAGHLTTYAGNNGTAQNCEHDVLQWALFTA